MMKNAKCEIWKDIPGYTGLYKVSNMGIIKSISHIVRANKDGGMRYSKEKLKKGTVGWHGYVWVSLCKNGKSKTYSVHRIVAMTFIDNPQKLPCVNHIDGDKTNNSVLNLEWCTAKENQLHAAKNGLLARAKKVMCVETGIIYQSSGEAERATNICGRNIRSACVGKYKKAGGFTWKRI